MGTLQKSRKLVTVRLPPVFEARAITSETLRAAYAVMQLAAPTVSLHDFKRMVANGRSQPAAGVLMGLFDKRDYVHAIFRAQAERSMRQATRLKVTEFTHTDSISTALMLEMIGAIEDIAREMGCERVSIEAARVESSNGLPLADVLVARGFSGESMVMARRI
jgi:hypothetical protein